MRFVVFQNEIIEFEVIDRLDLKTIKIITRGLLADQAWGSGERVRRRVRQSEGANGNGVEGKSGRRKKKEDGKEEEVEKRRGGG